MKSTQITYKQTLSYRSRAQALPDIVLKAAIRCGVAYSVERGTEKMGPILTRVHFFGAVSDFFFFRSQFPVQALL